MNVINCVDCRLNYGVKSLMVEQGTEEVKRYRTVEGRIETFFVTYSIVKYEICGVVRRFIVPSRKAGFAILSIGFIG